MIEAKILFALFALIAFSSLLRLKYTNQIRLIEKIVILTLFGVGVALIIQPDLLDKIASPLKIERGRDLLFYVYIIISTWGLIRTHIRLNLISTRINNLTGEVAMTNPERDKIKKLD